MSDKSDALKVMLRDVLAPLLRSDGSELHLVDLGPKELRLHVDGRLSGSPGVPAVIDLVIAPAVAAIDERIKLVVTSGHLVPKGAERLGPT